MPIGIRSRYEQLIKEHPEDRNLEVSIKNFDEALKHPNKKRYRTSKRVDRFNYIVILKEGIFYVDFICFWLCIFAGITAILAKIGIKNTDSNLATAIRTIVILFFSWLIVFIVGSFIILFGFLGILNRLFFNKINFQNI